MGHLSFTPQLCTFCSGLLDQDQRVQPVIYDDGEPFGGFSCSACLMLDDAALRALLRERAEVHARYAAELRAAADGVIRRPDIGVLELERIYPLGMAKEAPPPSHDIEAEWMANHSGAGIPLNTAWSGEND